MRFDKCPSTEEWIKKMWYIYIQGNMTQPLKSEIMPFVATWMGLKSVIVSEVTQRRRNTILHPLYVDSKKKLHK